MLAGTIWRFWWTRGQIDEATRWYERAFDIGGDASETARARGVFGAAHMAEARGDVAEAREQFEQAADLLRRVGATRWLILALAHLCGTYDPERAERTYLEALAIAEASEDVRGAAIVKANFATPFYASVAKTTEPPRCSKRHSQATALWATPMASHRPLRISPTSHTSEVTSRSQEPTSGRACSSATPSATNCRSRGYCGAQPRLVLAGGDAETAARLCSANDALCKDHGYEQYPRLGETTNAVRSALGDRFEEAWARGATLDLASTVELAVGALSPTER